MLLPIVDDVGAGAAIAGIVLPVHGHARNFGAKSAGDQMTLKRSSYEDHRDGMPPQTVRR
jgi:hypothetical protein